MRTLRFITTWPLRTGHLSWMETRSDRDIHHPMNPRPFELQDSALELATRTGDAECFLRHVIEQTVKFDGSRVGMAGEAKSFDLALRVFRNGREGISAGVFVSEGDIQKTIERASFAAATGRPLN